ncbi:MAG: DUF2779 domain-containing protein [Candidatus Kaelpia aquatica]|nr:DUF2779 domain-containing protein [Candidatus Kaelpia aquatica]
MLITKSKYISGLQCPKYLWVKEHMPKEIPAVELELQFRFDQGKEVGDVAKRIYPEGVDLSDSNFSLNINRTQQSIKKRQTIFEAGIMVDNIYSRIDILNPVEDDSWDIIEVKSSMKVKDEHYEDVAFQRYCLIKKGLKIRKAYIMHINPDFIKQGEIDPYKFMLSEDVTEEIDKISLSDIKSRVEDMIALASKSSMPDIKIGPQCFAPYECSLKGFCWKFIPSKNNVFIFNRGRTLGFELLERGILELKDIDDEEILNDKQKIQLKSHIDNSVHVDKNALSDFLGSLKYPAYFLDFETIKSAVPIYDNSRSYEDIPFQYVLYLLKDENSKPELFDYLSKSKKDPRKEILQNLSKIITAEGSIVAYFAIFEKRVLNKATEAYPEYRSWFNCIEENFLDLYEPFKNYHYYNPAQQGSNSLKSVLPAITGKGYQDLDISNGAVASIKYFNATLKDSLDTRERDKLYAALEEYCGLDTKGMIDIVDKLKMMAA